MIAARVILALLVCAVCSVHGDSVIKARLVHVGGDVPNSGVIKFQEDGMTIDSVMASVGMDLSPFYKVENGKKGSLRCPIRVHVSRKGERKTYDPSIDSGVLRALSIQPDDTVELTDFRKHPDKIEIRRRSMDRMIELGSTRIWVEIMSMVNLQKEYEEWRSGEDGATKVSEDFLRKEATRLIEKGKGQRAIGIIELHLGTLKSNGASLDDPRLKPTKNLLDILRVLVEK